MRRLLRKYKIINQEELLLQDISIDEFLEILKGNLDPIITKDHIFKKPANKYKGIVTNHSFKIKENRNIFDVNSKDSTIYGNILDKNSDLKIEIESNGMNNILWLFVFGGLLFIVLSPVMFGQDNSVAATLSSIAMGLGFTFMPLMMARSSSLKMIDDFKKEIFYIVEGKRLLTKAKGINEHS